MAAQENHLDVIKFLLDNGSSQSIATEVSITISSSPSITYLTAIPSSPLKSTYFQQWCTQNPAQNTQWPCCPFQGSRQALVAQWGYWMPGLECVWSVCVCVCVCVCVGAWQSRAPDVTVLEDVPGPRVSQTVIMHHRSLQCLKSCLHVNDPCWWEWRSVWNSDLNFWCQAVLWELSKIY